MHTVLKSEVMSQNISTLETNFTTIKITQGVLWQRHEELCFSLPLQKANHVQNNSTQSSNEPSNSIYLSFISIIRVFFLLSPALQCNTKAPISVRARVGTIILASCAASANVLCSISLTQSFALSNLLKV